jgi:hypothetical protein
MTEKFFFTEVCEELQRRFPRWEMKLVDCHIRTSIGGEHIANVGGGLYKKGCVLLIPFFDGGTANGHPIMAVEIADPLMFEKIESILFSWLVRSMR